MRAAVQVASPVEAALLKRLGTPPGDTDPALRQFLTWLAQRPGQADDFAPEQFTRTAVESYLAHLEQQNLLPQPAGALCLRRQAIQ